MSEYNNPHDVKAAHGGLLRLLDSLFNWASSQELSNIVWGPRGVVHVLGGMSVYYDRNGDVMHEDIALAYGFVDGRKLYDIHTFTNEHGEGKRAYRLLGHSAVLAWAPPLTALKLPLSVGPADLVAADVSRNLTTILEGATKYSAEQSLLATRILEQYGIYTPYSEDVLNFSAAQALHENPEII